MSGTSALLLFLSAASVAAATSPPSVPKLYLTLNDPYAQLRWDGERLSKEVDSLFEDMGAIVRWRTDEAATRAVESDGVSIRVLVRPGDPALFGLPEHTMGATVGREVPRAVVFIFLPNVLRTLGYDGELGIALSPKLRSQITRALARVVTHEIVHAVLPERDHDEHGLLSLRLSRRLLLQRDLPLVATTAAALTFRLRAFADQSESSRLLTAESLNVQPQHGRSRDFH